MIRRSRNAWLCMSETQWPACGYLLCVFCNCNSFHLTLFKLINIFFPFFIVDKCTISSLLDSYFCYLPLWSEIKLNVKLVIFIFFKFYSWRWIIFRKKWKWVNSKGFTNYIHQISYYYLWHNLQLVECCQYLIEVGVIN